jgi:antirestriction protein ArdC
LDVYQAITDKIIAAIEAGAGQYVMPWHTAGVRLGRPENVTTGKRYRGVNVVALWAEAVSAGFGSGAWASYRQWQSVGAQVRNGERGALIVFYQGLDRKGDAEEQDEKRDAPRFVARASYVFNAAQVEGWQPPTAPDTDVQPLETVDDFIKSTNADIRHGGDRACYVIARDRIEVPERRRFCGSLTSTPVEAYYATVLHELTHWTGAEHRLNRTFGKRFGDNAYAFEELVAELGAAFLCADLRVANEPRQDHAAYVGSWLRVLEMDSRAIFTASKLANEAAEFLLGPTTT